MLCISTTLPKTSLEMRDILLSVMCDVKIRSELSQSSIILFTWFCSLRCNNLDFYHVATTRLNNFGVVIIPGGFI